MNAPGGRLVLREIFDRSVFVGRHMETGNYNQFPQPFNKGTPVVYGTVATTMDMRTRSYLSGNIEIGLINASCAQMVQFYKLPIYATAGMSDAKIPDVQAGYEKMGTALLTALAGANFIHDAAGFLEFCTTIAYEQVLIDSEIIGMCMRALRGVAAAFVNCFNWSFLTKMRQVAIEAGLAAAVEGVRVSSLAQEVLTIAGRGLKKRRLKEERFLQPLWERLERGACPADEVRVTFARAGIRGILQNYAL